ncbi:hypothetical protein DXA38_10660 [[Clostridium] innocuum]|uniref:Uncharacterized protein n=1 Tax=Clostridium innocuum TaxID=1522 RepID=A0A3E2VX42_CLOIN|nr:hypothetical protein DXA38_10660 [[Clostridium] innocuum]RHV65548.1 hypothetical protein DXB22_08410 [Clostridiaceae bacterium OM02-2AC]
MTSPFCFSAFTHHFSILSSMKNFKAPCSRYQRIHATLLTNHRNTMRSGLCYPCFYTAFNKLAFNNTHS